MKRPVLLWFLFVPFLVTGQVPFVQPLLAPLAFNPSSAGNKRTLRTALIFNHWEKQTDKGTNGYGSVDAFVKKIKAGIGMYYQRQTLSSGVDKSNIADADTPPGLKMQNNGASHSFGLVLAPKYNIMNRTETGIKYTISPSLFVSYTYSNQHHTGNFSSQNVANCNCEGSTISSFDVVNYTQSAMKNKVLTLGLGGMFSSNQVIIFGRFQHQTEYDAEEFDVARYYFNDATFKQTTYKLKNTLYSLQGMLGMGITFPKNTRAPFSVTTTIAAEGRHYLNLENGDGTTGYETATFQGKKGTHFTTKQGVLQFKYHTLLFGTAWAQTMGQNLYGVSAGIQTGWMKTLLTFYTYSSYRFVELGTTIWLK